MLVYSPPLPYAMLGMWIKNIYEAKYILNIQDIFPQNAIDLGILKNRSLIKYFEGMENKVYDSADSQCLQRELGFVPKYDLSAGWKDAVQEMRRTGIL